ncbi:uncharacterized protein C2845_PM15G12480 [Panicum miliaceum]|uniref:F-box domain-containing protein n=1 Tax=Panicum miliaceum TaxID=4540 RepID=A0A3L6QAN5_PANMI|nr:uncharacterized protein C2845_PM15G12480 [Panicum miliaceum]
METELVAIPDDALADALRRLPARSLAAARCVCKAWRGVVDDRALLLPHLLPHSVRGIFNYIDHERPHLFARSSPMPAASPEIDDMLSFLPNDCTDWWSVMDHCDGLLLCDIELSLSSDKYQVINTPANIGNAKPYLVRLEKEACFGIVHEGQLQVWTLNESYGKMEWALRYQDDLSCYAHFLASLYNNGGLKVGPWTVKEDNVSVHDSNHTAEPLSEEGFEWDSDNDDIISVTAGDEESYQTHFTHILGFHPYKKVMFLARPFGVTAYNMNTSKAQYLGNSRPDCYYRNHSNGIYESFVYTPCMIGELEEENIDQSTS